VARLILAAAMVTALSLAGHYSGGHSLHAARWTPDQSHGVVGTLAAGGPSLRYASVKDQHVKLRKARTRDVLQYAGAANLAVAAMRSALSWVVVPVAASAQNRAHIVLFRVRAPPIATV
jgi:hypothetical protein